MTGFDAMKVADLTAAEFEGRRRMQALLEYARENVPGFERAYFVDFAPRPGCARPDCSQVNTSSPGRT